MFAATLGIDGYKIKTSKGREDLKYFIIKVHEGKLDEEGKTDDEKWDIFKYMIEDLKFYNGDHEAAEADKNKNGRKLLVVLMTMLIMMVQVIVFHASYVSRI